MTAVRIPPTLRAEVGGAREVEAEGATVRAVLEDLVDFRATERSRVMRLEAHDFFGNVGANADSTLQSMLAPPTPTSTSPTTSGSSAWHPICATAHPAGSRPRTGQKALVPPSAIVAWVP